MTRSRTPFYWIHPLLVILSFSFGFATSLALPSEVIAAPNSTLTLDNRSGETALVKIIGPYPHEILVSNKERRTVYIGTGTYYILTRYGQNPSRYTYSRGDSFSVSETFTTYEELTITLHPVVDGNYNTRPISPSEFDKAEVNPEDSDSTFQRAMEKPASGFHHKPAVSIPSTPGQISPITSTYQDLQDMNRVMENLKRTQDLSTEIEQMQQWQDISKQLEEARKWQELSKQMEQMRTYQEMSTQLEDMRKWQQLNQQLESFQTYQNMKP